MGKNQAHKSMQMAKHSSRAGGAGAGDEGVDTRYAGHDASFHTSEWHAARLAALTMERPSWDDWKKTQDEAAAREVAMEEAVAEAEGEYKAALEVERRRRMGYVEEGGVKKKEGKERKEGKDKKESKDKKSKKRKRSSKDKDKKKKHKRSSKDKDKKKKKKKRRHSSSSDSSSSGSSSDSDSSSSDRDYGGMGSPVRLSKFLNS